MIDEAADEEENPDQMKIKDITDEDRVNLRRTLYLVIMSSVDYEECAHKIMKMQLGVGHEDEVTQPGILLSIVEHDSPPHRFVL